MFGFIRRFHFKSRTSYKYNYINKNNYRSKMSTLKYRLRSIDFEAYTDGACKGNPGKGGWGWVYYTNNTKNIEYTDCGGEKQTTNNIMEMTAFYELLKFIPVGLSGVIYVDSKLVLHAIVGDKTSSLIKPYSGWMNGWVKSSWRSPEKNVELWKLIDIECQRHISGGTQIDMKWVKGHSGNPGNDRADDLSNLGIDTIKL